MGCFSQLTQSNFLSESKEELLSAQRKLVTGAAPLFDATLIFNKKDRKYVYDNYIREYELLTELLELEVDVSKRLIFYIQDDHLLFIYSKTRKLVDEAVIYNYNVCGDIPFCRSKHIIKGQTYFTALIDRRIEFTPISPN